MGKVQKKRLSVCDVAPRIRTRLMRNATKFLPFRKNFTWRGIEQTRYKREGADWKGISRQELFGTRGESVRFHVRYFEVAPGGFTSLEFHRHEHVVIGIRGRGICRVGAKTYAIGHLDALYIAPRELHQLRNEGDEPFGFLCIVNAKRDKPKVVENDPATNERSRRLSVHRDRKGKTKVNRD